MNYLGLHNKPKAEVRPEHKRTGPKEKEEWEWIIIPHAGSVVLRKKPQSTFCVSVRPWPHSDMHMWVPSFWTLRVLWI